MREIDATYVGVWTDGHYRTMRIKSRIRQYNNIVRRVITYGILYYTCIYRNNITFNRHKTIRKVQKTA